MSEPWSELAGQIASDLGVEQLAAALAENDVRVQIRSSCHHEGGTYIRVYEGAAEFTLERVADEYLASAVASSVEQAYVAAARLSWALAALGIRHAFEIYGERSRIVHYLHHDWPLRVTN